MYPIGVNNVFHYIRSILLGKLRIFNPLMTKFKILYGGIGKIRLTCCT